MCLWKCYVGLFLFEDLGNKEGIGIYLVYLFFFYKKIRENI